MIDRYLIRYFLAVVDQGNFSRAAAQENVSQPTLSVGIAKLERLVGKELFRRSNRRVELTEAGARFAAHAQRIETEFILAETAAHAAPKRSTLRLGVLVSIPSAWIAAFARHLAETESGQRVEFVEGRERELNEALGRGRIEAALTLIRPKTVRFPSEILRSEGYGLTMPANHPLAHQSMIEPEELIDSTMIVRRHCEALSETSRFFTRHGVRPFFAARTTNDDRTLALMQAGLGVTVMPECFNAPGLIRPKLAGFDLTRDIGLVYASAAEERKLALCPALVVLRRIIKAIAAA